MAVEDSTVRHIARLARIRVTDSQVPALAEELRAILHWVEQLDEVDTTDVEPMTRVVDMRIKMRDDVVTEGGIPDAIVANAPVTEDHFFVVPKVVE